MVRIIRSSVWVTDARLPLEAVGEAEPPGGRPPRRQRARAVAVRTRAWGENTIGKLNRWVILKSNFEVSGLVFSCIETKLWKNILVGKL